MGRLGVLVALMIVAVVLSVVPREWHLAVASALAPAGVVGAALAMRPRDASISEPLGERVVFGESAE